MFLYKTQSSAKRRTDDLILSGTALQKHKFLNLLLAAAGADPGFFKRGFKCRKVGFVSLISLKISLNSP